jgi:hypothetical protein
VGAFSTITLGVFLLDIYTSNFQKMNDSRLIVKPNSIASAGILFTPNATMYPAAIAVEMTI